MLNLLRSVQELINAIINWFYTPFKKYIPIVTFRYAATGGVNTLLDIFLYFIFYNFVFNKQNFELGFITISPHIAAFLFVFPITFSTGFILAKYITFTQSHLKGRIQLFRYAVSVSGSIVLNYVLIKLFVETFFLYATVAKIFTTIIVIAYSYLVQKYFSFRTNKESISEEVA